MSPGKTTGACCFAASLGSEGKTTDGWLENPTGDINGKYKIRIGDWQKAGAAEKLPFSLKLTGSHSGRITHRYAQAGAEDDEIVHANARTFWLGVKAGDRKAVASMMAYPVRAQVAGKSWQFHSAKEFVARYDAIFTPGYRQAVLNSVPHNMSSSWRGIMLGEAGEVWLNDVGKVKALNNP